MGISNSNLFLLLVGAVLLLLSYNEYFHYLRKKIKPREELTPNQLLTTHSILLLESGPSFYYRRPYWNHLHWFLSEHGHNVVTKELSSLEKPYHIFFTKHQMKAASKLSQLFPDKIASLNLISDKLELDEEANFFWKNHVQKIQIPRQNRFLWRIYLQEFILKNLIKKPIDLFALGTLQDRSYYERILKHCSIIAEKDLQ